MMYYMKMLSHSRNDKLMIRYLQDNLSVTSLKWYMNLERIQIWSWRDLADAFLKQYKFKIGMAPDRRQFQNMTMKDKESFKEYAQCWR